MATKIILSREKQVAIDAIKRSEAALREAVAKLHNIQELEVPLNIGNIAEVNWVREQLNGRIALVKSDKSLTAVERESRLAPWRAIKAKAERAVTKIADILQDLPLLEWLPDEDGLNYHLDPNQVEEQATRKATREVPPMAEQHWQLIQSMKKAVEDLRQFEFDNNLKDASLFKLSRLTQEQVFDFWLNGDIFLRDLVFGRTRITNTKTKQIYY